MTAMSIDQEVFALVESNLQELNEELEYESLARIDHDTAVFGTEGGIDSLSLVRLIVELESQVNERFGKTIALADEAAMSSRRSPFRTVGSLVDFIVTRLNSDHA